MKQTVIFLFSLILMVTCAKNPAFSNEDNSELEYKTEKFNANYYPSFNQDSTHILYTSKKSKNDDPTVTVISYFVYDRSRNKVIFEEKNQLAKIDWLNNNELEIKYSPGNFREGEDSGDYIYIYNVISGKKHKKSDQKLTN